MSSNQPDDFNPEVDTIETYNATPSDDVYSYVPRCYDCGTSDNLTFGPCPYALEVGGIDDSLWLCPECYRTRSYGI